MTNRVKAVSNPSNTVQITVCTPTNSDCMFFHSVLFVEHCSKVRDRRRQWDSNISEFNLIDLATAGWLTHITVMASVLFSFSSKKLSESHALISITHPAMVA